MTIRKKDMLPTTHEDLRRELAGFIPEARLVRDPLRLLAWGSDASFYRLVPRLIVVIDNEAELRRLLAACARHGTPLTFRAAGTSLAGQALSDSVLVMMGDGWRGVRISADASTVDVQPAVIGAAVNRALAPHGRRIGPDPASIDAAMVGGIAANNASGMCCGTAQNSYHTLAGMRVVLADGSVLDTRSAEGRAAFAGSRPGLLRELDTLAREVRGDASLSDRIRHKFRLKNTTGYSLNALVDFEDPVDILQHLMIGSEGTLGFISEIRYTTVPDHPHRASALILFSHLHDACEAVVRLKRTPVSAVELLDRAALRSVQGKPGMPDALQLLGDDGAALLVELRGETEAALTLRVAAARGALEGVATASPPAFTTEAAAQAAMWNVRKGIFPAIGAMRPLGTTVIIEDVAFPVERLAEATLELQALCREHGYDEAVIYGHALEGNLHFVFTQDFGPAAEVQRYQRFIDAVCRMVVERYDGSLKAEHGTGRNMAPYVELEWGAAALAVMKRIKALLDPQGLLNPGVILNADPQVHLKNLKPLPAADPLVDRCIECGFCEPKCPSRGLTLSPRQRIAGWREIARAEAAGENTAALRKAYDYQGLQTCAACGLCATACPVGIETGALIKQMRKEAAGPVARRVAGVAARHYGKLTTGVRLGLKAADLAHGLLGTALMSETLGSLRRASAGQMPHWSPALSRGVSFKPGSAPATGEERVVYFPSCAARSMGTMRNPAKAEALPAATERLLRRAGFDVIWPEAMGGLCCGQPFESKGLVEAADAKAAELEQALLKASEGGRWPVVFDTSPCAYRMRRFLKAQGQTRLVVHDGVEFVHEQVAPRLHFTPLAEPVAVHPVCSVRKMGSVEALMSLARRCSAQPVAVDEIQCCGFAGDRGFTHPELNAHALRHLKPALPPGCRSGVSSSPTCEIGLASATGLPYESILALVERCTRTGADVDQRKPLEAT